ncbi:ArsR/SmtB family transcription factor [Angustibacter aerolatus]
MPSPVQLPVVALDDCCSTVTGGVLDADTAERLARSFKALGDPTRVRLLSLIAATDGGEACICDLTGPVGLSQPTVSHHMRQLVEAGLVSREQRGRWAYYAVVDGALAALGTALTPP